MAGFELIHLNGLFDMERKRQSWNRDMCTKPFQIHGRNNLAQSPHAGKNVYDNQKKFHCDIQLNCWMKIHFSLLQVRTINLWCVKDITWKTFIIYLDLQNQPTKPITTNAKLKMG